MDRRLEMYPPPGTIVRARRRLGLRTGGDSPSPASGSELWAEMGETFLFFDIDISNTITPYWVLQSSRGVVKWFDLWISSEGWMHDWEVV